ncbi:hypothetical protein [Cribrihabitans neustonicus]
MKQAVAALALLALAACETGGSGADQPQDAPSGGVSISGYARIGASHTF